MARIDTAETSRQWSRPIAWLIAALTTLTLWSAPAIVHACKSTTVCFEWNTAFTDGGAGEDYLTGDGVPAGGSPVTLIRPPPEAPISTVLPPSGCMTFETQYAYGHRAIVYGEAVIGGVRVRPGWTDDKFTQSGPLTENFPTYFWEVDIQGVAPGPDMETTVSITVEADDPNPDLRRELVPLLGAATGVLSRFDEIGAIPEAAVGTTLVVMYHRAFSGAACDCDGGDDVLRVGVGGSSLKFMVAHELGHWLHTQLVGSGLLEDAYGGDYGYGGAGLGQAIDPPCKFDKTYLTDALGGLGGFHGLRSAEWASAAMIEGFAHFASTFAMNNTTSEQGEFRYYKRIDPLYEVEFADLIADDYVVDVSDEAVSGGQNQWVKLQCPNDWAYDVEGSFVDEPVGQKDDISTELDWMRFFWRLTTEQDSERPALSQVLAFVGEQDWELDWVWPIFAAEVASPGSHLDGFEARFEDIGEQEGVNNGL
jgi:hypothetical protein